MQPPAQPASLPRQRTCQHEASLLLERIVLDSADHLRVELGLQVHGLRLAVLHPLLINAWRTGHPVTSSPLTLRRAAAMSTPAVRAVTNDTHVGSCAPEGYLRRRTSAEMAASYPWLARTHTR